MYISTISAFLRRFRHNKLSQKSENRGRIDTAVYYLSVSVTVCKDHKGSLQRRLLQIIQFNIISPAKITAVKPSGRHKKARFPVPPESGVQHIEYLICTGRPGICLYSILHLTVLQEHRGPHSQQPRQPLPFLLYHGANCKQPQV